MRVYDINPSNKGLLAFEINAWLGRRRTTRVISKIPCVRMLRGPRWFAGAREEVFCEFELVDQRFNVWQPLGSGARYWIGPSDGARTGILLLVRQAFIDYQIVRFPYFRKLRTIR
jgi:hypothetical protein